MPMGPAFLSTDPGCLLLVDAKIKARNALSTVGRWASPHHVVTGDQRSPMCTVLSVVDGPSPSSRLDAALIVLGAFETVDERIALLDRRNRHQRRDRRSP